MEDLAVVKALAALAQPVRLQVFRALVVAGPEGLTPGVLSVALDIPSTSLSFHLKELMNADLASQERSGRNLIYRAGYERMNALMVFLTANCCEGASCVATANPACAC